MSSEKQGMRYVVRAFLITMVAAVVVMLLVMFVVVDTTNCGSVSQGLAVVMALTAVLFVASTAVVGVRTWRAFPTVIARLAIMVVYVVVLVAIFIVMSCGLMVMFNC